MVVMVVMVIGGGGCGGGGGDVPYSSYPIMSLEFSCEVTHKGSSTRQTSCPFLTLREKFFETIPDEVVPDD